MQRWTKYLERCKDDVNWTGLENLNIDFCQILTAIVKISFLQSKLDAGLCLDPTEIFLIFFEFLGSQDFTLHKK